MKKAILTLAIGEMANIGRLTLPPILAYGEKHGYDVVHSLSGLFKIKALEDPHGIRYPLSSYLLDRYDVVVWLDSDVLIVNQDKDILDDVASDTDFAYAEVYSPWLTFDHSPNDGVFVARNRHLLEVMDHYNHVIWWSPYVGALHAMIGLWKMLGIDVDRVGPDCSTDRKPIQHGYTLRELPHEWNVMPQDTRPQPETVRFMHFSDRDQDRRADNIRITKEKYNIK